mgnify:CR=1 FL=1
MANRGRGEIEAVIDGRPYTLCLTLGALAELEGELGAGDLGELAAMLGRGALTARMLAAVIRAGLRGGGHETDARDLERMRMDGAAAGFVRLAGELIAATFANPGAAGPEGARVPANPREPQAV